MDIKKFKQFKKYLDEILEQLKDEALKEGQDIFSPEFESVLSQLKQKILAQKGISLLGYETMEREIEQEEEKRKSKIEIEIDEKKVAYLTEKFQTLTKKEKEEIQQIVEETQKEIQQMKERIEQAKKEIDYQDLLNKPRTVSPEKIQELEKKIPKPFDSSFISLQIDDISEGLSSLKENIVKQGQQIDELAKKLPKLEAEKKNIEFYVDSKFKKDLQKFVETLIGEKKPKEKEAERYYNILPPILRRNYEPMLGNPSTDGYVLSSTIKGVRSWIASGGAVTWGSITGTLANQTDLQTALDLKATLASPTFTGTVTIPTPFTIGAVSMTSTAAELNILDGATLTVTELNYVDGVTSAIQTQINGKQPLDATLTSISALGTATDKMLYTTGIDTWAETALTTAGRALIDDADAATQRTTLGLVIGTNVQAWDTDLDTWATKTAPSGTVLGTTDTQTLTNKRINPREATEASNATPTPNSDTTDIHTITALAAAATFGVPTGIPVQGQKLIIRIKDNATARALSFNAIYRAGTDVALPTTTVISKTLYCGFIYNSTDTKWDLVAVTNNI